MFNSVVHAEQAYCASMLRTPAHSSRLICCSAYLLALCYTRENFSPPCSIAVVGLLAKRGEKRSSVLPSSLTKRLSLSFFLSLFAAPIQTIGVFHLLIPAFSLLPEIKENFLRLRESASVRACVRKRMEWRCFNTSEGRRRSSVRSRQKLARGDSDALHFFPLQRSA